MRTWETFNVIKNLFDQRTGAFLREGHELSERDNSTVRDAYVSLICVVVDLGYLNLEDHKAEVGRIISDLYNHDLKDVLASLADAYALVQRRERSGFKALIQSFSPALWRFLRSDVEKMYFGDAVAARNLLQVTALLSRLSLVDISLEEEAIYDYLAVERDIKTSFPTSITSALNRIIRFWTKDFDPGRIRFRHGSGSVAFVKPPTLEEKYKNLGTDRKIEIVFKDSYNPVVDTLLSPPSQPEVLVIDRRSETTFVPKSWKSMRTISMESPTLMYLQQGILAAIDDMVEQSTYLRNRIGTHDQSRNRILAEEASIWRNYATIDLSAASDSVAWSLVKEVFKNTPLYPYLIATRSTHTVLPNEEEVFLKKYAPMGSALCFPIETMIFASICELVTRRWQHNCAESGRFSGRFSVYGDDIICPTECAEDVIDVLQQLGFRVNGNKSFWREDDWYRESCGGEYIDGVDVTPIRLSRNFQSECLTINVRQKPAGPLSDDNIGVDSSITGYVDGANAAFDWGYPLLRHFFIRKLTTQGFTPVFGERSLKSFKATNYHTRTRHNRDIQRPQVFASLFVPMNKKTLEKSRGDEAVAYRHWLEQAHYRQIDEAARNTQTVVRPYIIRRNGTMFVSPGLINEKIISETRVGPPPRMRLKEKWISV